MGALTPEVEVRKFLPTPVLTSVTATGGTNKTWTYKLVGLDANGDHTAASAGVSTNTGGATLGPTVYNDLAWTDPLNAVEVQIWRTASGGTPATLGLIATVAAGVQSYRDEGAAGDAATAPTTNTTGYGEGTPVLAMRFVSVFLTGTFVGTYQLQRSAENETWFDEGAALTAPGVITPDGSSGYLRWRNTAYTSGTAVSTAIGHAGCDC